MIRGKGKGRGVRLRHMAQRFHEQSEDRNLSLFLSCFLSFSHWASLTTL